MYRTKPTDKYFVAKAHLDQLFGVQNIPRRLQLLSVDYQLKKY